MPQVSVTLNSRTYRLSCEDGDQQRLSELANYVKHKVDGLIQEFGQVGEERLLLMAALLVADELFDVRAGVDPEAASPTAGGAPAAERPPIRSRLSPS
jgi:cell division protein ZapA